MTATLSELDLSAAAFGDSCMVGPREPEARCDAKAVITVTVGCVHEHLLHRAFCQYHVERLANGRVKCGHCWSADGHDCEMHLLREIPTP